MEKILKMKSTFEQKISKLEHDVKKSLGPFKKKKNNCCIFFVVVAFKETFHDFKHAVTQTNKQTKCITMTREPRTHYRDRSCCWTTSGRLCLIFLEARTFFEETQN